MRRPPEPFADLGSGTYPTSSVLRQQHGHDRETGEAAPGVESPRCTFVARP
jgi:hypothetical protein